MGMHVEEPRSHGGPGEVDRAAPLAVGQVGVGTDPREHPVGDGEGRGEVVLALPGEDLTIDERCRTHGPL